MAKKSSNLNIPGSITISGTSSNISITHASSVAGIISYGISNTKTTYHVLGEDVQVSNSNGYKDITLVTNIATLNVLGKPFLDELHKNGTYFPNEIEEYLEKKFKWLERDKKIDNIIN
jgi:hypothetical protein